MKRLLALLIVCAAPPARGLTLNDFRYANPHPPESPVAEFAQCDERLGKWPTFKDYAEVEDSIGAARDYFERWVKAPSGEEFAKRTLPEALAIDARMVAILEKFELPPKGLEVFDLAQLQIIWIQTYLGYVATVEELTALRTELETEIDAYTEADPPDELRERWLHDIMLLTQQAFLANQRGLDFEIPLELMIISRQLTGHQPG